MRLIDETHLAYPAFGSRQMTRWLRRHKELVNRKRVRRLMREKSQAGLFPGAVALEPTTKGAPKPKLARR